MPSLLLESRLFCLRRSGHLTRHSRPLRLRHSRCPLPLHSLLILPPRLSCCPGISSGFCFRRRLCLSCCSGISSGLCLSSCHLRRSCRPLPFQSLLIPPPLRRCLRRSLRCDLLCGCLVHRCLGISSSLRLNHRLCLSCPGIGNGLSISCCLRVGRGFHCHGLVRSCLRRCCFVGCRRLSRRFGRASLLCRFRGRRRLRSLRSSGLLRCLLLRGRLRALPPLPLPPLQILSSRLFPHCRPLSRRLLPLRPPSRHLFAPLHDSPWRLFYWCLHAMTESSHGLQPATKQTADALYEVAKARTESGRPVLN